MSVIFLVTAVPNKVTLGREKISNEFIKACAQRLENKMAIDYSRNICLCIIEGLNKKSKDISIKDIQHITRNYQGKKSSHKGSEDKINQLENFEMELAAECMGVDSPEMAKEQKLKKK